MDTQVEGGSETVELFADGRSLLDLMAIKEAEREVIEASMAVYDFEESMPSYEMDVEYLALIDARREACRKLREKMEVRGE